VKISNPQPQDLFLAIRIWPIHILYCNRSLYLRFPWLSVFGHLEPDRSLLSVCSHSANFIMSLYYQALFVATFLLSDVTALQKPNVTSLLTDLGSGLQSVESDFKFIYPAPGTNSYVYRNGDTAILDWFPPILLDEVYLKCGPDPDVYHHATGKKIALNTCCSLTFHSNWTPFQRCSSWCSISRGLDPRRGRPHLLYLLCWEGPENLQWW